MLAPKTPEPAAGILSVMSGPVQAETPGVRVESVGQAAAGGLLLAIAVGELLLGFWAVSWHHRAAALVVAGIGLAFLATGLLEIAVGATRRPADAPPERSAP